MTLYEKCQQTGDTSIHDEYVYIGSNGSGTIELPFTGEQIKSICTQGDNDIAVEEVATSKRVAEWVGKYSDDQIRDALKEYGPWSDKDLVDAKANVNRLVWTLAWNVFDSDNPNDYLAADDLQG